MVNYNLSKELGEERESRERLRQKVGIVKEELAKLTQEKHDLLQLMGNKVTGYMISYISVMFTINSLSLF